MQLAFTFKTVVVAITFPEVSDPGDTQDVSLRIPGNRAVLRGPRNVDILDSDQVKE